MKRRNGKDTNSRTEKSCIWYQYLSGFTAILMAVSCGLSFGWPSPAIPKLQRKELGFNVSKAEISYMVMIGPLGYIVGCPISAILMDKIGRKPSILMLVVPQIISWLLIANCHGVLLLYAARLTAGIAGGSALTTVPVYVCEIAEPKIRGALGTGYAAGTAFGTLLINFYGSYTSIRTSAYISLFGPLLFIIAFIWAPESPYFYLIKGRIDDAREALKKLRKMNNVDDELTQLTLVVEKQISEPKNLNDVFTVKSNLRAFIIVTGLRTLQYFTGGASINIYNQMIFEQARGCVPFIESSIIYSACFFLACFFCSTVVDKFGRRPLMMCSLAATAVCLFAESLYFYFQYNGHNVSSFNWLPITMLILYAISRASGLIPIPILIAGELFSASIKAKAMGIINIYTALCFCVSTKLFQCLAETFGMYVPFFVYVCCSILGLLFVWSFVPETKQQTLEEIQQKLKHGNDPSGDL